MLDQNQIISFIKTFDDVFEEQSPSDEAILFKKSDKLFAVLELSSPNRLSLRCDPGLAKVLREKYETVMPGVKLNPKDWNTLVLTGQVDWDEIQGFIRHSYQLLSV